MKIAKIANRIRINNQRHYHNNNKVTMHKYALIDCRGIIVPNI